MEPDHSLTSGEDTPEQDPAPAQTEDQSRERFYATDEMVTEEHLVGLGQNKLGISEILDKIRKKALSVLELSLQCEEIVKDENKHDDDDDDDEGKENDLASEHIHCVDSEFHDFKKTTSSFKVGKIWALYDPIDDMPRFYAKIKKITNSGSSFQVTWLESKDEEGESVSLPVACGKFKYGTTETIRSNLVFSHEMKPMIHGRNMTVIPRKGETWALFRDWKRRQHGKHKPRYRYDFVEIMFSDKAQGVGVAYLGRVKEFTSVFSYEEKHGCIAEMIGTEEMRRRFSHRVPSFRLTGDYQKNGVPVNSFELDPAAIILREDAVETETQSEDEDGVVEVVILD